MTLWANPGKATAVDENTDKAAAREQHGLLQEFILVALRPMVEKYQWAILAIVGWPGDVGRNLKRIGTGKNNTLGPNVSRQQKCYRSGIWEWRRVEYLKIAAKFSGSWAKIAFA
jgi:hypothetical protein